VKRIAAALVIGSAACGGFLGLDEDPAPVPSAADAAGAGRFCADGPWSKARVLNLPVGYKLTQISFSSDGKTAYLSGRTSTSDSDLFLAPATDLSTIGTPKSLDVGSPGAGDFRPTVTADARLLAMASLRSGTDAIFLADLSPEGQASFPRPVAVAPATSADAPYVTRDGLEIYFVSASNLFVASRASRDVDFNGSAMIGELSTGAEGSPVVTVDQRTIFFERVQDVFFATRANARDPWGAPQSLDVATTNSDDAPMWISDDGCTLLVRNNEDFVVYAR
jgi:hypothetical protein